MGMYTELFISTRVKNDSVVISTLKLMLGMKHENIPLPNHELFKNDTRWCFMLQCSSFYFVPYSMNLFKYSDIGKYWVLISRSDFKNYNNDINLFLDWIKPYLDIEEGKMIGYSLYEEDKNPIIYYK